MTCLTSAIHTSFPNQIGLLGTNYLSSTVGYQRPCSSFTGVFSVGVGYDPNDILSSDKRLIYAPRRFESKRHLAHGFSRVFAVIIRLLKHNWRLTPWLGTCAESHLIHLGYYFPNVARNDTPGQDHSLASRMAA